MSTPTTARKIARKKTEENANINEQPVKTSRKHKDAEVSAEVGNVVRSVVNGKTRKSKIEKTDDVNKQSMADTNGPVVNVKHTDKNVDDKNVDGKKSRKKPVKNVDETKTTDANSAAEVKTSGESEVKETVALPKVNVKKRVVVRKLVDRGIHIGAARVKQVLLQESLNPKEYKVQQLILEAENKLVYSKPTEANAQPVPINNGKPTEMSMIGVEINQMIEESSVYTVEQLKTRHSSGVKNFYIRELENDIKVLKSNFNLTAFNAKFKELADDLKTVMNRAEQQHEANIMHAYEREHVDNYDETKRETYVNAKKDAKKAIDDANASLEEKAANDKANAVELRKGLKTFNEHEFNLKFDPKFYDGVNAFKQEHDKFIIGKVYESKSGLTAKGTVDGKKTGVKLVASNKQPVAMSAWRRANSLVCKLYTRLSGNTRNLVACFLDYLVEQFALNGLHNALLDGEKKVSLEATLRRSDGYLKRTPLYRFAMTFNHFDAANKYLADKVNMDKAKKAAAALAKAQAKLAAHEAKVEASRQAVDGDKDNDKHDAKSVDKSATDKHDAKSVKSDEFRLEYPKSTYEYSFDGYVGTICNNTLVKFANSAKPEDKEKLMQMSINKEVKQFCANLVYEAIVRIGDSLRDTVESRAKTISDAMVKNAIRQIHIMTGSQCDAFDKHQAVAMVKFNEIRKSRRDERKAERDAAAKSTTNEKSTEKSSDKPKKTKKATTASATTTTTSNEEDPNYTD